MKICPQCARENAATAAFCESCGKPLNEPAINRKVVELFAHSGADAWYTPEADTILPTPTRFSPSQ